MYIVYVVYVLYIYIYQKKGLQVESVQMSADAVEGDAAGTQFTCFTGTKEYKY